MVLAMLNLKIILVVLLFLAIFFFLYNITRANQKSDYILNEGVKDKTRLDFQNELLKNKLIEAFETAKSLKNLEGLVVVDFGCGASSTYPVIKEFIGDSGKYIGVDSSESQIATAKQHIS